MVPSNANVTLARTAAEEVSSTVKAKYEGRGRLQRNRKQTGSEVASVLADKDKRLSGTRGSKAPEDVDETDRSQARNLIRPQAPLLTFAWPRAK